MDFGKLAWMILKIFVGLLIFSLVTSVTNVVPYYMKMVGTANDILLRASVNNYILEDNVREIVREDFVDTDMGRFLTYRGGATNSQSVEGSGVFVYSKVSTDPAQKAFTSVGCTVGDYCPSYATGSGSRRVILNEGSGWDPKTKDNDTIRFRNPPSLGGYGGAQRGETITVRVETKMRAKAVFAGLTFDFQIPLSVERSAPAMHYYRI